MRIALSDHLPNIADSLVAWLITVILTAVASFAVWRFWGRRRRLDCYLPLILSDSPRFAAAVEKGVEHFFSRQQGFGRGIPRLKEPALSESSVQGELDPVAWRRLLGVAIKTIRKSDHPGHRGCPERLHLVFGTLSLWNFALGTLLRNRHGVVVYHFQQAGDVPPYHRIWQMDRSVKDLRSPSGMAPFEYWFLAERIEEPARPELRNEEVECLVFRIGANEIDDSVRRYRDANLPGSRLRIYTKRQDLLPDKPEQWIIAAAEIAHAICDQKVSRARKSYLFMDMPAVLALMAGDAIGGYQDRTLCLMQWDKNVHTYKEIICIPDEELSRLAG